MTRYSRKELEAIARDMVKTANGQVNPAKDGHKHLVYRGWEIVLDGSNTCVQAQADDSLGRRLVFNCAI